MSTERRVLLLGAGLVAGPVVRYLLDQRVTLTVAANNPDRAAELVGGHPGGRVVGWGSDDLAALARMIDAADVVVSLLPATMHVSVAQRCIAARRHLVTASYLQAGMQALDGSARAAGVVLLNELGLDPGIDHMSAMAVFDRLRAAGARLVGFRSYCGGLPAPDANTNPWAYKVSWSPLGVLRAATRPARFLHDGQVRDVPPEELFAQVTHLTVGGMTFEAYPNHDSLSYIDRYGLQGIQVMLRATLRWPGWAASMRALQRLDLLSADPPPLRCWRDVLAARLGAPAMDADALLDALAARLEVSSDAPVIERLRWLGLLDDAPLPAGDSLIEALAAQVQQRMAFGARERDMVVLHHRFDVEHTPQRDDAGAGRRICATLVAYGEPGGDSAMARTVGLPVAIGARLLLDGVYGEPGVQIPVTPALYEPILAELASHGIDFEETER